MARPGAAWTGARPGPLFQTVRQRAVRGADAVGRLDWAWFVQPHQPVAGHRVLMSASTLLAALVTFAICAILTPIFAAWARHRDLLDVPNHRSSHVVATPRTGGWAL